MSVESDAGAVASGEPAATEAEITPIDANSPESSAPAVEVAASPEPATPAPVSDSDKRFAAKFAALNRKERAASVKVREAEARLAAIEARIKAAESAGAKPAAPAAEDFETRLLKDPFNALKDKGLGFEKLTEMALNGGKLTPEMQMQVMRMEIEKGMAAQFEEKYGKKISEYEQRIQKEQEAAKTASVQQAESGFKKQISDAVTADANLQLLAAEGPSGIDLVYEVLDAHFKETGILMGHKKGEPLNPQVAIKLASELVENELMAELEKRMSLSKAQKLVGAALGKPATQASTGTKPASPTLTNKMGQVSSTAKRHMSDDESKRDAAKLIRWTEE